MVKHVLVTDAAGVHAAAVVRALVDLEDDLGVPLPNRFDLFAGNGFGGVVAAALASNQFTARTMQAKLFNKAVLAHVLETSPWRRTRGIVQDTPLASGIAKRDFFRTIFKDNVPVRELDKVCLGRRGRRARPSRTLMGPATYRALRRCFFRPPVTDAAARGAALRLFGA